MQTKHPRILFRADEGSGGGGEGDGDSAADGDRPLNGAALRSALEKERKARKDLEKQVKDLRTAVETATQARDSAAQEQADRDKSETDKLRERLERVEAERDQERTAREAAEQERERVDRVRRHAGEFDNPDDVVALLRGRGDLGDIESDDDAQRVLGELKRDRPNLLKQDPAATGLEQILRDGQPQQPGQNGQGNGVPNGVTPLTWEELNAMNDKEFAALKQTDPERYWASLGAREQLVPRLRATPVRQHVLPH